MLPVGLQPGPGVCADLRESAPVGLRDLRACDNCLLSELYVVPFEFLQFAVGPDAGEKAEH